MLPRIWRSWCWTTSLACWAASCHVPASSPPTGPCWQRSVACCRAPAGHAYSQAGDAAALASAVDCIFSPEILDVVREAATTVERLRDRFGLSEPYRDPLMEFFGPRISTATPRARRPRNTPYGHPDTVTAAAYHRQRGTCPSWSPTPDLGRNLVAGAWCCSSVHALWRRPISLVSIWTGKVNGRRIYISWGAAGVHHCAGHDLHRSGSTPRWPSSSTPPRGDTRGEGVSDGQPIDGLRQPGPGTAAPPVPGTGPTA